MFVSASFLFMFLSGAIFTILCELRAYKIGTEIKLCSYVLCYNNNKLESRVCVWARVFLLMYSILL